MVDEMKTELKRVLRSRMNATINSVCVDFEEHVDLSSSNTATESADFDSYFDDCRQLVKYIATTMDTSPNFVEQMDCIILASRNNASTAMVNSVVKQDVWFHDRKEMKIGNTTRPTSIPQMLGKRKPSRAKPSPKRYRVDRTPACQFSGDENLSEEEVLPNMVSKMLHMDVHEDGKEEDSDVIDLVSTDNSSNEEETNSSVNEDVVDDFCLLKPQSPGQLKAIKTWMHDVNRIIDAQCCEPPAGYVCSRSCSELHEKMNKATGLHHTWQSVEDHLEECENQQCELKTRVELRQTMNLIEVKQLEICGVRHTVKEKKVIWSRAVHYNDKACWIGDLSSHEAELQLLEETLQTKKEELVLLESKKASLCARMDIIRLDWRDEMAHGPDGNALHYINET